MKLYWAGELYSGSGSMASVAWVLGRDRCILGMMRIPGYISASPDCQPDRQWAVALVLASLEGPTITVSGRQILLGRFSTSP